MRSRSAPIRSRYCLPLLAMTPTTTTIVEHGYDAIRWHFSHSTPRGQCRPLCGPRDRLRPTAGGIWLFTIASIIVIFHWARYELRAVKSRLSPYWVIGLFLIFPNVIVSDYRLQREFVYLSHQPQFVCVSQNSYVVAGVAAALASATRVQGVALVVFFLLEYLTSRHRRHIALLPVAMSAIGIGGYMSYLWVTFGNPQHLLLPSVTGKI